MRRIASVAGAALFTLTAFGCSSGAGKVSTIATDLQAAVDAADGVASADITGKNLGESGSSLQGTVRLEGIGAEAVTGMRNAYTAMVPVLRDNAKSSILVEVRFADSTGAAVSPTQVGLKETPYSYAIVETFGG
jgi:hypothetical protein